MSGLDDIIKSIKHIQNISEQMGLASRLKEFAKAEEVWKNNLSGIRMLTEIANSFKRQAIFNRSHFSGIDNIAKTIASMPKFEIPTTAFDAIRAISKQHEQIFRNLRNFTQAMQPSFGQINSLQIALSGISGQLATIAAAQKKWNLLTDFEEISNEAIVINERIIDDEGITYEVLNEIKSFLERIGIRVDKIDADASSIFWKTLAILCFILAVVGELRNWTPKANYATKEEVESIIKNQFSTFESKLKIQNEYRTTNRVCKVMWKPKRKSLILDTLPVDYDVIVLQCKHKWIYVSYISPKDNLPQTGWVLKKYLSKPN